ncbi:glycosyltransferase family 2 protein [Pseudomonadales bacterium]|nr:glycosyltransferase family 2 protein [Pseudomonadales bacterium]
MKLSIVTTLYQSEQYIEDFHRRISAVAKKLVADSFEIIFVNDGSPDRSLSLAIELTRIDPRVKVVDLSRNFGHHQAMMTGLSYARGEKIFLVDSDLEEDPELLQGFFEKISDVAVDVVYGVQLSRRGNLLEKLTGWAFYKIFRLVTGVAQPDNVVTARLMSRRYVDALLLHKEREINIGGLWIITGFAQIMVPVEKRSNSPTTYSLSKKFSHLVNAITSFSSMPLVVTFYSGLLTVTLSLAFSAWLVFNYFFHQAVPDGYTSLIVSIWFLAGVMILFLGIQGIYIAKIFFEVKQRPLTIVKEVHQLRAVENKKVEK